MEDKTAAERSEGLERVKRRLPGFMEWLEARWEDARPLEVRASGKYDWLVDGDTPMVDDYTIEGGNIDDPRHTIWMIIGLGTGKALQRVLEKAGNHVARILLVEDDPAVWKCAMVNSPLRQIIASDIRVFPVWSLEETESVCNQAIGNPIILGSADRTLFFVHKGQADREPEHPKKVLEKFAAFIRFRYQSLGNSAEDTLIGFNQIVRNFPNLLRSYTLKELWGKFEDYPAVIVSAGPSLEKNVHLLKEVQDKCIIIAVDTVLRKLPAMGITPHFVVAIERGRLVYDAHYADLPVKPEGVIPVNCSVCLPEISGTWEGPFIMTFKILPLDRWFAGATGLSVLHSGSSCAHMGLGMAFGLGCKKIALIGQDLAFSPEGKTHTDGTYWEEGKEDLDKSNPDIIDGPGALAGKVKTTKVWFYFKQIFEQIISGYKGAEVYDATEGGLLIEGTKVVTLDEFLADNVLGLPPLPEEPVDMLSSVPMEGEGKPDSLKGFLKEAADSLDSYLDALEALKDTVEKVMAAGLSVTRRRRSAYDTAAALDRLVNMSPIMTFILQAHISGAARVINESKLMQSSDELRTWRQELDEFTGTAEAAGSSAKAMLNTMIDYIDEEPEHRRIFEELDCAEGLMEADTAELAWETAQERKLPLFAMSLFNRFDFRQGHWKSNNALELGRRALELGFVERSRKLLSSLIQNPSTQSDPSFWNDLAISYCLYEFGVEPEFEQARTAFQKAIALDPTNEERSRNYLAMEHIFQRRVEAAYRHIPDQRKNAAAAIGFSWENAGRLDKAVEWYQRAIDLAGDDDKFSSQARQALERSRASAARREMAAKVSRQVADNP
ncbi:MAG: DUF115 domain-containing protein [Synergistota bacterium]|nr:DUF115 domain-containing protein [Synergistota bacterium]